MTNLTTSITKYDPDHTDFENPKYFPVTNLFTYNQMIDVIADPWVTLAVCTLSNQMYLTTYGGATIEPIQEINLVRSAEDELEALEEESIITYFSIPGELFGTSMQAWDIYRQDTSNKRSQEADSLAKKLGVYEGNTHNQIEYTPKIVIPESLKITKIKK